MYQPITCTTSLDLTYMSALTAASICVRYLLIQEGELVGKVRGLDWGKIKLEATNLSISVLETPCAYVNAM